MYSADVLGDHDLQDETSGDDDNDSNPELIVEEYDDREESVNNSTPLKLCIMNSNMNMSTKQPERKLSMSRGKSQNFSIGRESDLFGNQSSI